MAAQTSNKEHPAISVLRQFGQSAENIFVNDARGTGVVEAAVNNAYQLVAHKQQLPKETFLAQLKELTGGRIESFGITGHQADQDKTVTADVDIYTHRPEYGIGPSILPFTFPLIREGTAWRVHFLGVDIRPSKDSL